MTFLYFLVFYAVSLGLGYFVFATLPEKTENQNFNSFGLLTGIGLCCLPIWLFIFNLFDYGHLKESAIVVSIIAGLGLMRLFRNRRTLQLQSLLNHFYFIMALAVCFFVFGEKNYFPSQWDEFSHWLTMPKQMFVFNSQTSLEFPFRNYMEYTPGWPLINLFFDLLFSKEFNLQSVLLVNFVVSSIFIGAMYDLLKMALRPRSKFVLLHLLIIVAVTAAFIPIDNLIELPLMMALLVLFLLFFNLQKNNLNERTSLRFIGIVCCYIFLLKNSMVSLVPVLALFCMREKFSQTKKIKAFVLVSILILVSAILWSAQVRAMALPVSSRSLLTLWNTVGLRTDLFYTFPLAFLKASWPSRLIPQIFIILFLMSLILKKNRINFYILWFLAIYSLGLLGLYLTSFGNYEAYQFASIGRYTSIPIVLIIAFGYINWIESAENIIEKIFDRLKIKRHENFYVAAIFFLGFSVLMFFSYKNLYHDYEVPYRRLVRSAEIIKAEHFNSTPKLLILEQGQRGFSRTALALLTVENKKMIALHPDFSFGPTPDNVWRSVSTPEAMTTLLNSVDLILIQNSDPWIESIFEKSLTNIPRCNGTYEGHLYIKRHPPVFECVDLR